MTPLLSVTFGTDTKADAVRSSVEQKRALGIIFVFVSEVMARNGLMRVWQCSGASAVTRSPQQINKTARSHQ